MVDMTIAGNFLRAVLAGLAFLLACAAPAISADTSQSELARSLKPIIEKAQKSGATVIVVGPGSSGKAKKKASTGPSVREQIVEFRSRTRAMLLDIGNMPSKIGQTLSDAESGNTLLWMLYAVLLAGIALGAGYFTAGKVDKWAKDQFKGTYRPDPETRTERLYYLLMRGVLMSVAVGILAVVALTVVYLIEPGATAIHKTAVTIVVAYVVFRLVRIVFFNILTPDAPSHRLLAFSDQAANKINRRLVQVFTLIIVVLAVCNWMDQLGLDQNAHKLLLSLGSLMAVLALSAVFWRYREVFANAIRGGAEPAECGVLVRFIAGYWHLFAVIYLAVAWVVATFRLIMDYPAVFGLVGGPVYILVAGLIVYAIALLIVDRLFRRRREAQQARKEAEQAEREGTAEEPTIIESVAEEQADGEAAELDAEEEVTTGRDKIRVGASPFQPLVEHACGVVIFIAGISMLASVWGVDFFGEEGFFVNMIDIGIIVFMAYFSYRAVEIWVDAKRAEEGDVDGQLPGEAEGPGGKGQSRLVTLLPIFRNFLLITIVVISGMIVLSELGVDIGPLFAGAGVVGLAIGFGAQTLIRDIFSGAFFLMDDAFRKGEYIDIGTAKGMVEKISIRSFQLRHHNGPLNTIPFGEIKQLTNYSRDWVMMKLPLRVTYDTDIEQVRKLIKRLGQDLLQDEELGPKFLQPLKSQGVIQMDDSAMIIRVKFMTRPGDQFGVRNKVYTRIRELFEEKGIKFAHREVTVRVADDTGKLNEKEKEAVAGAVLPAIEQNQQQAAAQAAKADDL